MRPKWMCGKCAHCSSNNKTTTHQTRGSESAAHGAVSCDFERSGNPRNSETTRKIEREVTDVLGSRAEGLPVRDVGIASLDALDFVPVSSHSPKKGERARKEKKKEKGKRQVGEA
jgi:hypothetical protein